MPVKRMAVKKGSKIRMVRAESNQELVQRIIGKKGHVILRVNLQIYDPDAKGGKGSHAGLMGESFSVEVPDYETLMKDIAKMKKQFE